MAAIVIAAIFAIPWLYRAVTTVSTDDAYVNGHVTFVAPRVGGQVLRVLVDDNNVVRKGDLIVELFERDLELHVEFERLRRLRTIDDIAHHARAFIQLDHGDGVRRGEAGRGGAMIDDVAVKLALAARLEHRDLP